MRLEARINRVTEDSGDLSITLQGWCDADPAGTLPRPLGTINIPSNDRTRRAYYIGRRLWIDVKPA